MPVTHGSWNTCRHSVKVSKPPEQSIHWARDHQWSVPWREWRFHEKSEGRLAVRDQDKGLRWLLSSSHWRAWNIWHWSRTTHRIERRFLFSGVSMRLGMDWSVTNHMQLDRWWLEIGWPGRFAKDWPRTACSGIGLYGIYKYVEGLTRVVSKIGKIDLYGEIGSYIVHVKDLQEEWVFVLHVICKERRSSNSIGLKSLPVILRLDCDHPWSGSFPN